MFVVDDSTFPIHLKYLFAGVGAGERDENISLLADISRVRPGDFVIFYIEGTTKRRGGFYGIFKISNQEPLVFYTPGEEGNKPELPKKLIYRTLIEPHEVYAKGVPEWEVLDKLPVFATDVQWSLIYRKLKGKRGCSPLLPWEAKMLMDMIKETNSAYSIAGSKVGFDWDSNIGEIKTTSACISYTYDRTPVSWDLIDRICELIRKRRAYEVYLQLYFVKNIEEPNLSDILGSNLIWFGNEFYCGMGMQKMDVLTICQKEDRKEYRIIELKDEPPDISVVSQIEYYVKWSSQDFGRHLRDANSQNIQPVVVAPEKSLKDDVKDAFKIYNKKKISLPILYFEFSIDCQDRRGINFKQVYY